MKTIISIFFLILATSNLSAGELSIPPPPPDFKNQSKELALPPLPKSKSQLHSSSSPSKPSSPPQATAITAPPALPADVVPPAPEKSDGMELVLIGILLAVAIGLAILAILKVFELKKLKEKYGKVIDVEAEVERIRSEIKAEAEKANLEAKKVAKDIADLKESYRTKRITYDQLAKELAIYENNLEMISYGIYTPHFELTDSEQYKTEISKVEEQQKQAIANGQAIHCSTEWQVGGSKAEGKKMTTKNMKLMMRAFNNECDSIIAKVKWNTIAQMEERIRKAHEAINKFGEVNQISISRSYMDLKLKELWLNHEKQQKIHEEKEQQRELREQMREEEKVRIEMERKLKETEEDETRYQKALEKARSEVEKAEGEKKEALAQKIGELEGKLAEAIKEKERTKSRAEQTRSGYVYVVSNIGSFGEDIYKIGMTRRLDPQDRVDELGNASVPFFFDVHAMIYSEDAPKMESELQKAFHDRRLNLVNHRKEFFSVNLSEIEEKVQQFKGDIEFTKVAEAEEYRKTLALKAEKAKGSIPTEAESEKFPAEI